MATLYSFILAFNPQKVLLALEENQLLDKGGLKVQQVNVFNGDSLRPWFMKINPNSTVPVLVTKSADGKPQTLNQTIDILKYADSQGAEPLGGSAVDRALVDGLVDALHGWDGNLFAMANIPEGPRKLLDGLSVFRTKFAQAQLAKAESAGDVELAAAYRAKLTEMEASAAKARDPALVETNQKELAALLDRAEGLLEKSEDKYLAGSAFSMADVVMTAILHRLGTVQQTDLYLKPRPRLSRYFTERIKTRPSYEKVLGPAKSSFNQAAIMLPSLLKAKFASITGWYC